MSRARLTRADILVRDAIREHKARAAQRKETEPERLDREERERAEARLDPRQKSIF